MANLWLAQIGETVTGSTAKISIIIVNYNVKDYLANCISSLMSSAVDADVQIIVIDNDSFDGSVEMLKHEFPQVDIIAHQENVGFGKAVNAGIDRSKGDYILVLNPDTIVQENTLATLLNRMADRRDVGICGPKILNADGTLQLSCKRSFPTPWVAFPKLLGLSALFPGSKWAGRYNLTYLDPDEEHSVDAVSGSCMFIRRKVIDEIGLFDERFFMFGEDLDLCFRAMEADWEIKYVPATQIVHYKGESVKVAPFDSIQWFYQAMSLFVDKHFSKTSSLITRWGLRTGIFFRKVSSVLSSSLSQLIPVALDVAAVITGFLIAIPLRFGDLTPFSESYLPPLGVYIVLWLIVGSVFQLYSRFVLSYNRAMLSSMLGFLFSVAFTYFFIQFAFSRVVLLIASLVITFLIPGWRLLAHVLKSRGFFRTLHVSHSPIFSRPVLIVGAGREGRRIAKNIGHRLDTGIYVVGFTDNDYSRFSDSLEESENENTKWPPFLGMLGSIEDIVSANRIRELIFSSGGLTNEEMLSVMDGTKDLRLTYRIVPRDRDILLSKASVEDVSDFPFVNIEYSLYHRLNMFSKRAFDTVVSILSILMFSPVLLFLRLRFREWKKVNFWGVDGTTFSGLVTPARGRFLRELPLLFNILSGNMSFVGISLIPVSIDDEKLMCKPGLTGLDRIKKLSVDSEERSVFEHYYVQHQSIAFDLEIMIRTLFAF